MFFCDFLSFYFFQTLTVSAGEHIPEFDLHACIGSLFTLFIFTGLEQRFYKTDIDCVAAGKPLPEFDLYISTVLPLENKGIRSEFASGKINM